jgi:oligopeptide transport system ATP-binding protein
MDATTYQTGKTILSVRDLRVHFTMPKRGLFDRHRTVLKAVDGISFELKSGETLGIVVESGCG